MRVFVAVVALALVGLGLHEEREGAFDGVAGLRQALLARPEVFVGTMTEKLLTYALGRGLDHYDGPAVRRIVNDASTRDYQFSALVLGIVESNPFQMRRSQE